MLSGPLALALSSELKAPQLHPHHTKGQQGADEGPQGTCQGPVCLILWMFLIETGGEKVYV